MAVAAGLTLGLLLSEINTSFAASSFAEGRHISSTPDIYGVEGLISISSGWGHDKIARLGMETGDTFGEPPFVFAHTGRKGYGNTENQQWINFIFFKNSYGEDGRYLNVIGPEQHYNRLTLRDDNSFCDDPSSVESIDGPCIELHLDGVIVAVVTDIPLIVLQRIFSGGQLLEGISSGYPFTGHIVVNKFKDDLGTWREYTGSPSEESGLLQMWNHVHDNWGWRHVPPGT